MRTFVVILFVLLGPGVFAQTGSFTCKLTFDYPPNKNVLDDFTINLYSKNNNRSIWPGENGKELIFFSENIPVDTFSVQIGDLSCFDTIIHDVVIAPGKHTELAIHIPSNCEYDKSVNDKTCPVCLKTDEIIPVIYGLQVYEKQHNRKKAEKDPKYYAAGCIITCCDPNWYCKRDRKLF